MNIKIKVLVFSLVLVGIVVALGHTLNPFDPRMFGFHDDTQGARISQIALNIKEGKIPPRIAPQLSHNMGFPVLNFYAPSAYYITTGLHLLGMSIPMALKFSFLLTVVFSFITMFLLLNFMFGFIPALVGGITYTTSLWFAVEIFVRGNLAECWFLVFFPLSFYVLFQLIKKPTPINFFITTLVFALTLTTHNVLSLLALFIYFVVIIIQPKSRLTGASLLLALLSAAYFLIPSIFESGLTYASYVAQKTSYKDHFLCMWQMWKAPSWDFSGSAAGCIDDGMPFTLGKIHILLGVWGMLFLLYEIIKNKKIKEKNRLHTLIFFLGIGAAFLTTYQSAFLWNLLSPLFSLFQFPWRLLVFTMFSLAYFSGYLSFKIRSLLPSFYFSIIFFSLMAVLLFTSSKFFSKPWLMSYDEYTIKYISPSYISKTVAYNMAEYLPKTADYVYWRSFSNQMSPLSTPQYEHLINSPVVSEDNNLPIKIIENNFFNKKFIIGKQEDIVLNIHYFPFWEIKMNGNKIVPDTFDKLGRPIIELKKPSEITITYKQTLIEVIGNTITLITFIVLGLILFYKPVWKKIKLYLK